MKKTYLFLTLLLLAGCSWLSNLSVDQQCLLDNEACQQHLSDFNQDRAHFLTEGAYLALYDMSEHKFIEEIDARLKNTFYIQKNVNKLLDTDSALSPDDMLKRYVSFIDSENSTKALQMLRENVQKGTARNANSKNCNVYGLTATDYISDDEVVATFLGHFVKNEKTYAIIVTFDSPKALKSTYGFTTSGWNATKLAGKIINNMCMRW